MIVTLWGVRGSMPCLSRAMQKYGGNTPCISIHDDQTLLILDAGSGILELAPHPMVKDKKDIHILLTHLHVDHIQGLGFFNHFFDPEMEITLWGPSGRLSLAQRLNRYLSPPLFPVRIRDFNCNLEIHHVPSEAFEIGAFRIESDFVSHRGTTLGFRISNGQHIVTYLPDHEPALGVRDFPKRPEWTSGNWLAQQADVLIHDAQYTDEEYQNRQGWGHSAMSHAIKFGKQAEARKLFLFHHDPMHTDNDLEASYNKLMNGSANDEVVLAKEGTVIPLGE
jgi:phosphoribosyl 1,2-cyclic phosphodiesterase